MLDSALVIYLAPSQGPRERLAVILQSAREESRTPLVRTLAHVLVADLGMPTKRQAAQRLLDDVAQPRFPGLPEPDETRGQYVDTDVPFVVAHGGDCIERSHALIALALALGIEAEPVWIREPGVLDHVVATINVNGVWFYADALDPTHVLDVMPSGAITWIDR